MIYGHGDDTYQYEGKVKVNFSSNIFPDADLSALKEHLSQRLDLIGSYPEPEALSLERLIAQHLHIPENSVLVTNGANEAIYLIAQLYRGWASVIPQPTYTEYADACKLYDHLISYDSSDELELLPEDRIYWLCNPNNPTGNVLLKPLVSHIVRQHPRHLYVVDQSYEDYTQKEMLVPAEMTDCYNLMIIHSLSKKYCIPGLRLGYITASPIIIDRLRSLRQPWSVNALAIEAGKYLVTHQPKVVTNLTTYLEEAQRLMANLSAIEGVMVMDTATNFMLVNIDRGSSTELKRWLVEHYGLLIRDASNFYGLDSHCFRVAAQRPKDNDLLVAAIREYLNQQE